MEEAHNIRQEIAHRLEGIPAEQIKQVVLKWLDEESEGVPEGLQSLIPESNALEEKAETSFSETASHEEWSKVFHEWVDSHRGKNLPILSDEDISRESMYPDRF